MVTLSAGSDVSADELLAHCRTRLASYKCPRSVELRDSLPLSPAGKVLKATLRAERRTANGPEPR